MERGRAKVSPPLWLSERCAASPSVARIGSLPLRSGGPRAAAIYSLIETAKLNRLDPQAYLTDLLARIADRPAKRVAQLLPWNWKPPNAAAV